MSREPWNTGTGGGAVCEDMPRKSLDIRSADHPPAWERGSCAFPCFRRGRVRAEPGRRVKGRVPCGFSGQRPEPSESLPVSISTDFQGSIEPVFLTPLFHSLFDTTWVCLLSHMWPTAEIGGACLLLDTWSTVRTGGACLLLDTWPIAEINGVCQLSDLRPTAENGQFIRLLYCIF